MTAPESIRFDGSRIANDDPRCQPMARFATDVLGSGFHMDLRGVAGSYGPPEHAEAWLDLLMARREHVLPVTVLQLGLGAWQRGIDDEDSDRRAWARIARLVADWAVLDMDGHGRFAHLQPMPHTYAIAAPWYSAMAQGLGASLLTRHGLGEDAARAAQSLLDPESPLVFQSAHGPILEEYPAEPRPHVLNGWIWALFGLYDLAICPDAADDTRDAASAAFDAGIASLTAQLPEYETGRGWSTYDRYPHPIANVASPFYHRLHVEMLYAAARIARDARHAGELTGTAERWHTALGRPITRATAVARKVGFRLVIPRGRAA